MIPDDDREHFGVFCLNNKHRLIGYHEVSVGSLTASIVHPREVFKPLILAGAAAFVCVHNHPTGDPAPSPEDQNITRNLKEAADLLSIRFLDHVVIGNGTNRFYSFTDHGMI
jgi:DNA repair protein RadC